MEHNRQSSVVKVLFRGSQGCFISSEPARRLIFIPKGPVMTLTTCLAPGLSASSGINVPNVSEQATINASATSPAITINPVLHPQLQEQTFQLVTPIKYQVLDKLLQDPNRSKVD